MCCGAYIPPITGVGFTPTQIIKKYGVEYIRLLVEKSNARTDVEDMNSIGPFIAATFVSDLKTMEYLLSRGADKDAKDNFGMTAMHHAIDSNRRDMMVHLEGLGVVMENEEEYLSLSKSMFVDEETDELYLELLKKRNAG